MMRCFFMYAFILFCKKYPVVFRPCALFSILLFFFSSPALASFGSQKIALASGVVTESSPTLADIDNDGIDEILIGTLTKSPDGSLKGAYLIVMKGDGTILWKKNVEAPINSSPAVGDIDNDGEMEIIVSVGGDVGDTKHQGGIKAFDHNGNLLWTFRTLDDYPTDGYSNGVYSSPTLCDTDGNGTLEIAFGAWDRNIYLLDHNGTSLWNNMPGTGQTHQGFHNGDTSWSTAACADLNSDGSKEIIIGADITGGGILPDGTHTVNGGFLYIFDKNGGVLIRKYLPEAVYSSPAVADLNNDGIAEIVVGTSWNFWYQPPVGTPTPKVYVFSTAQVFGPLPYSDSAKLPNLPGWPQITQYPGFSSPGLADLDNDGDLEIVIGSGNPFTQKGQVLAWHYNGTPVSGWPVTPINGFGNNAHITSSPTIADIDGDGQPEVLFSMLWDIQIYNSDGTRHQILPTAFTLASSPAIGDTNGDGTTDIWIGGGDNNEQSQGYLWHFSGTTEQLGNNPWPMFHKNAMNSGAFPFYIPDPPGPSNPKGALPASNFLLLR